MKPVLCKGVDISSLNESYADLSIIQKAGYTFAMIRCAQGARIIDSWFDRNVEAAEKLGMPWGAYILTEATTDYQAKAEAERKAKEEQEARELEEQEQRFREQQALRLRYNARRLNDEIMNLLEY